MQFQHPTVRSARPMPLARLSWASSLRLRYDVQKVSPQAARELCARRHGVGAHWRAADARAVNAFIQSVRAAARQPSTTVGIGEMVRLSASDLVGAALQVDGCCVHLAAFRRQAFENQGRDQGRPKARMTRSSARARPR